MPLFALVNPILTPALGQLGLDKLGTILSNIFQAVLTLALIIGGIVFLFMLIWGGYQFLTAGGDKEALGQARKRLISALVGLTILLCILLIIRLASQFFGINLISYQIPSFTSGFSSPPPQPTFPPPPPTATRVPTTPPPTSIPPTPTSFLPPNTCQCDIGSVVENNCTSPNQPYCISSLICQCLSSPPTPTPTLPPYPNCKNVTGPSTIVLGNPATYTFTYENYNGPVTSRGTAVTSNNCATQNFWQDSPGGPGNVSFTWTPTVGGRYVIDCRAWNDGIAECRGNSDCVSGPPVYRCPGPFASYVINVVTPTPIPPTPTLAPILNAGTGDSCAMICSSRGLSCVDIIIPGYSDPADLNCPFSPSSCYVNYDCVTEGGNCATLMTSSFLSNYCSKGSTSNQLTRWTYCVCR